MSEPIRGIHHVTAIATDPQRNLDFYEGLLGLRLVKKTVNFDDPGTYHFYFGDDLGRPGTILTFFPWPHARRGSRGSGQVVVTSFAIPEGSLPYWQKRLEDHHVLSEDPKTRFEDVTLTFFDPDGLKLELVARPGAALGEPWTGSGVPPEHAIRGFDGVTLAVRELDATATLLTKTMGLRPTTSSGNRFRFEADGGQPGARVDVLHSPDEGFGRIAAGSVHHVAWRVPDDPSQLEWRERIVAAGLQPTPVLDRQYFKSIYFREPGGVLFEFATDSPGFTRDETREELGSGLKLPPWLEPRRPEIEETLPAVSRPAVAGTK